MNIIIKIVLYLALVGGVAGTGYFGYKESQTAFANVNRYDSELTSIPGENIPVPNEGSQTNVTAGDSTSAGGDQNKAKNKSKMMSYFLACALLGLMLAFMLARDVASAAADKAVDIIYNTDAGVLNSEEYEKAEGEADNGNYLQAIDMMRSYYKRNPSDVFAARRIAEIYENDLQNFEAAALEYENILTLPLPSKRWSWMAIHLCNIYTGKLNNQNRALELLQQVVTDHTNTPAGLKARERLEKMGYEIEIVDDSEDGSDSSSPAPKGFSPK